MSADEKLKQLERLRNKRQAQKTRKDRRVKEQIYTRRLAELLDYTNFSTEKKNALIRAFGRKHKDLSDDVKIGRLTWKTLKEEAMSPDYTQKDWFLSMRRE